MKHQPIRILSILLVLILAFSSLPLSVIAENVTSSQDENQVIFDQNFTTETTDESDNIFIVQEDTTKRGEFEKHYICSDGTYVVASYAEAIHYKDDNGKWLDVDNRPMQTTEGEYTTHNGDFGISVPSSAGEGHLMRMDKGEHSLSWTLSANKNAGTLKMDSNLNSMAQKPVQSQKMQVNTSKRPEVITSNSKQPHENHKVLRDEATFDLPNVSGKVRYNDLFGADEGVSVVYTTYRNKIEEDIYIEKPTDITSFSMEVEAPNLIPRLNADNSVDFLDNDGRMCYHVGIPYMMDADFAVLNDIETTVSRLDDTWVITYTPDVAWFTSEERAYPILLDPSITTNDYVSNIEDTYVEENSTTNHIDEQYLYITANGNNKRNAVVRITKLPVIDESMPVISAKLTLTTQYAPFSDVALKAGYCDTALDLDEYDYCLTSIALFNYTAYSYLVVGSKTVTFDVTSHIYDMYDDEEYDKEHGYDYHGDFIIGYATNGDTTFTYPFFSSEYTASSSRPIFTVKYGYTLPAGILDGEVYSFQNCGSYSYMTVNGATPANNSNIYQVWNDKDIATTTQKFKLEYVASTGGYLLRSMCSSSGSDKVVSIQRGTGELYSGRNVRLYSATDSISQEWLIVPVDYDVFKIVPRANMSLALTAYGYDDGTNTGRSSTSEGNIFVQTLYDNNSFQQWYIFDNDDYLISTEHFRASIETNNYYVSNSFMGKYLHRSHNDADCMSGTISGLGVETVKWQIVNLGDGYCTIQRSDMPHYYLAPIDNTSGSRLKIYSNFSETIPEKYKWSIRTVTGDKYLIQHKSSGYYLYALNQSVNPSAVCIYPLYSAESDGYRKQTWRIANEDNYVELGYGMIFNDMVLNVGEIKGISIKKQPSNAYWSSLTDFDYTIVSGNQYITYNEAAKEFTGLATGIVTVRATHKLTGITRTFYIFVFADIETIECLMNCTYDVGALQWNNHEGLSNVTWHTMDPSIATVSSSGVVSGVNSGYTFVYATVNNSDIAFMYEVKIMDIHTQMLEELTNNEIQYLYCPSSYLNLWTSGLPNAFETKVEILYALRDYYTLPIEEQPTRSEIKNILEQELDISCSDENMAAALFNECFLGYEGQYNEEYLTSLRIQYFGYLKEIVSFCAFSMAAQLDPINSGSACNGAEDLKTDLASCWTNNKESSDVMLGTNYGGRSYVRVAEEGNYKYFYSKDYDYYRTIYGNSYTRDINMKFLDKCFEQQCTFYFSHHPTAYTGGSLYAEYQYITNYYSQQGKTTELVEVAENLWKLIVS